MKSVSEAVTNIPLSRSAAPRQERPSAVISSADLFIKGARDVFIEHEGSRYRLTLTRQNKLILTK